MPLYHVGVHSLAKRVLDHIQRQELTCPGDRVGVAVSGGIDSVALLRLMLEARHELGIVLAVVHFNHKLRGADSDADQEFVAALSSNHGLEFFVSSGDAKQLAERERSGVEAAARELRYSFFYRLLGAEAASAAAGAAEDAQPGRSVADPAPSESGRVHSLLQRPVPAPLLIGVPHRPALDKILTAHTLDDQAETVLMRVIRGTGLKGLGGIHRRILVVRENAERENVERENSDVHGEIVRPLLGVRRRELEGYVADVTQEWREDPTNAECGFTRNRVRNLLMPILEREFNPAVAESLAELAEIARDEEDYWDGELSGWQGTVLQWAEPQSAQVESEHLVQIQPPGVEPDPKSQSEGVGESVALNASLSRPWLLTEPRAVQKRAIKAIGEQAGIPLEFKHVEEILRFAAQEGETGKKLSLPRGWRVVRESEEIIFLAPDFRTQKVVGYEYFLPVPGRIFISELGVNLEALTFTYDSAKAEYNAHQLLRADSLREPLIVRNWRAGDRFWPQHTKAPKKVKELLQQCHVHEGERKLWPVAASGDQLVWMRGFATPAGLSPALGQEAVMIREVEGESF